MGNIRLGMVGFGNVSKYYVEAIKQIPELKLSSVLETDEGKKERVQRSGASFYKSNELHKFFDSINAVIVATPPYLHTQQTIQALRAGKDVLCEKPIATNICDAYKMIKTAQHHNRVLVAAQHSRFGEGIQELIKNKDKYGEILEVEVNFLEKVLKYMEESWIFDKKKAGGGCIIDSGINALAALEAIVGDIQIIDVRADYFLPGAKKNLEIEAVAGIDFEFGKNRKGRINLSWIAESDRFDINFRTSNGVYIIDYLEGLENLDFLFQEYRGVMRDFLSKLKERDYVEEKGLKALRQVMSIYKKMNKE